MKRPRYPSSDAPLPPPLPPETRTVGQLIGEALKLYSARFWPSLALGIGPGIMAVVAASTGRGSTAQMLLLTVAGSLLLSASYVGAIVIAAPAPIPRERLVRAYLAAVLTWIPVPFLAYGIVVPIVWLAWVGLVVPVVAREGLPLRPAFGRAVRLARADLVHAIGALATLVVVAFLCQSVLFFLIRGQSDQTKDVAAFLANLVIAPLLFLGAALLYEDQAARLRAPRERRKRRDAALHPALDADRAGSSDAEREPRAPARRQP